MSRSIALSIVATLMCGAAHAQNAPDRAKQADQLFRASLTCPIKEFYNKECTRDECKGGMLAQKLTYRYLGNAQKLHVEATISKTGWYSHGIMKDDDYIETFEVMYKNLDPATITVGVTPVTKRALISVKCTPGNKCVQKNGTTQKTSVGFGLCNQNAAEDAKLALEELIKAAK